MDIVAQTSAVWCREIGAENRQGLSPAEGGLNRERYQVGFRIVSLPD